MSITIKALSYGETFAAAELSEDGVLTFLCTEPTVTPMACCEPGSTGCALGGLIKDLHAEDGLRQVIEALGVLDLDRYGHYDTDAYFRAAALI